MPKYKESNESYLRNTNLYHSRLLGLMIDCQSIFNGVLDYSGYPDCRPEYIKRNGKSYQVDQINNSYSFNRPNKSTSYQAGLSLGGCQTNYQANKKGEACGDVFGKMALTVVDPTKYAMKYLEFSIIRLFFEDKM